MSRTGRSTLVQRARPRVVALVLAREAASLAVLLLVPFAVALALGQDRLAWRLGAMLLPVAAIAFWGWRLRSAAVPEVHGIEALVVTALTFALGAVLGVWPFMASGLDPVPALFEAMSAITSTGLTLATGLEDMPYAVLFMRHWFQWYGGFAIIVLAVGLVLGRGGIARRVGAVDIDDASRLESARTRSRRILAVYVGATLVAWLLMTIASGDPAVALLYALSAVATGGFAPNAESLAGAPQALAILVLGFCLFAAISFDQWIRTGRRGWRSIATDAETRLLLALIALGGGLVYAIEWRAGDLVGAGHAWGQVLSAQTTAGFTTMPVAQLEPASQLLLVGAMLVGGDVGSTAGGFKLVRLLLLAAILRVVWLRCASGPRAVLPLKLKGYRVEPAEIENATALVIVMLLALGLAWLIFLAHGLPPLPALFDVASALATTGLTAGVVGPDLPSGLIVVLTLLMWLGRVELLAVLVLFIPATWRSKGS